MNIGSWGIRTALLAAALVLLVAPATAGAYVYWANYGSGTTRVEGGPGSTLGRGDLAGTFSEPAFVTGANYPLATAVDNQYVYWANAGPFVFGGGTIGRLDLDGGLPDQTFITGANAPSGVAVTNRYVYWSDYFGQIGRANLDRTEADPNFITDAGVNPCGIAVGPGYIYWAVSGDRTIARATLSPALRFVEKVEKEWITLPPGSASPCGVAVDATHVYWANTGDGGSGTTLGRATLSGGSVDNAFITGASGPCGVAVTSTHIYWANRGSSGNGSTIGRAALDRTDVDQSFHSGASGPCGPSVDGRVPVAPPTRPSANTGSESSVGQTSAVLNGTVNPNGSPTTYYFEYGPTSNYGFRMPATAELVGSDRTERPKSVTIDKLSPNTTYHFRIVAENQAGISRGIDHSFTTPEVPAPQNTKPPRIIGSALVGSTVRCDPGTWINVTTAPTFQWFSGGTGVPGAVNQSYEVRDADAGQIVYCSVIYRENGRAVAAISDKPTVPKPEISVGAVRVTQGLDFDSRALVRYDLIARKDTLVRFSLSSQKGSVRAKRVSCSFSGDPLRVTPAVPRNGNLLPSTGQPLMPAGKGTYDCWVPANAVPVDARARVNIGVELESGRGVGLTTGAGENFQFSPPVHILAYMLTVPEGGEATTLQPSHLSALQDAMVSLNRAWPVPTGVGFLGGSVNPGAGIRYTTALWDCPKETYREGKCDATSRALSDQYIAEWNKTHPASQQIDVGIALLLIPPGQKSGGGQACGGGSQTAGAGFTPFVDPGSPTTGMATLIGQELSHCFGLVDPKSPNYCTEDKLCDEAFGGNSMHSIDFDFGDAATAPMVNTLLHRDVGLARSMVHGYYAFPADDNRLFLQGYEWNQMHRTITTSDPVSSVPSNGQRAPARASYTVTGLLTAEPLTAEIGYAGLNALPGGTQELSGPLLGQPVKLELQLRDERGKVVSSEPFTVSFQGTHGKQPVIPFSASTPPSGQAASARIVERGAARLKTLAAITLPASRPKVTRPHVKLRKGRLSVRWRAASKAERATLRSRVFLLRGDQPPVLLTSNLEGSSYSLSTTGLASGPVRIRVEVSDGLHLVERTSRVVRFPAAKPAAHISTVVPGKVAGVGVDPSSGLIADEDMRWRLDGRPAARGAVAGLRIPPGRHRLKLTVTAPSGRRATARRWVTGQSVFTNPVRALNG